MATCELDIELELVDNVLDIEIELINEFTPCPEITCVFGGTPFTTVYPTVNGLLKGGTP